MKFHMYRKLEEKINGKMEYSITELRELVRRISFSFTIKDADKILDEMEKMKMVKRESQWRFTIPKNHLKYAVKVLIIYFLMVVVWANSVYINI